PAHDGNETKRRGDSVSGDAVPRGRAVAHAVRERVPVDAGGRRTAAPVELSELRPFERNLLGDLFAIIEEHAADSALEVDRAQVERAFVYACRHHADQRRKSGEEFINHPVGVAKICAGMRLDTETLCAALLHDTVEDTS